MNEKSRRLRVAYFAHDWGDAAIGRRVAGFARDRIDVAGFASYRTDTTRPGWVSVDLGQTYDNGYFQRLQAILRGAKKAQIPALADADLIVARNLDMLLTALRARRQARLATPVIYECLDIHRFVARQDRIGTLFRTVERHALRNCAGHWVSSPAFLTEHFERHYPKAKGAQLLENRLQARIGVRPNKFKPIGEKLRIGWFGNLRCARSLRLLSRLSKQFEDRVEIVLRGYPAQAEIPDFDHVVNAHPNVTYGGRYHWPDELGSIYDQVDLVWAGDFMDAGLNSQWLLPNRLYEGGWYGCPPVAPAASQTGQWIVAQESGFVLEEPLEETLPRFIDRVLKNPKVIAAARCRLLELPDTVFVEPPGTLARLVKEAIRSQKPRFSKSISQTEASIASSA
ncbi:MAG: glycosyl transferase family 1 [Pseudomonadota bacterium]